MSTRPRERNGFELSTQQALEHVTSIEKRMRILPEDDRVYELWKRLLVEHDVRGVQVHDAHLAATLMVHGITHLLTFNGADFKRYAALIPVHPEDVQS